MVPMTWACLHNNESGVMPTMVQYVPGVDAHHGVYPRLESHGDEPGAKVLRPEQDLLIGQPLTNGRALYFHFKVLSPEQDLLIGHPLTNGRALYLQFITKI